MTKREAILEAAKAAESHHRLLGSQEILSKTIGSVDVFGSVMKAGAALLFRPLDGLLGACLVDPAPGVIVTSNRPLSIQRFTCAHELGHLILRHQSSVDGQEIISGKPLNNLAEAQANHFATAFLTPRWLFSIHAQAQGWNRQSLQSPDTIYQLSLRLGASYLATLVALKTYQFVSDQDYEKLAAVEPRQIKKRLLGQHAPENFRGNVWLLTDKDRGRFLEGQPNDLFVVRLNEKSGAGYLWTLEEMPVDHFRVVNDTRSQQNQEFIGGPSERILTIKAESDEAAELSMKLQRPWERQAIEIYTINCDLHGKEEGLPRSVRLQLASAA